MKQKLFEIINTDCYIQFDTNEQLREWVKKAGVNIEGYIMDFDTMLCFSSGTRIVSRRTALITYPIHHHTNIEI